MNRQEFEEAARRYREELFRMYAGQTVKPPQGSRPPVSPPPKPPQGNRPPVPPPPVPPQDSRPPVPPPPVPPRTVPAMAIAAELPAAPDSTGTDIPAQTADDIPDSADAGIPAMPKRAYTGIIRVHVATAQGAKPVAGAAVIITQITGSEPELISLQTTDRSGNTEDVTVPAPPPSEDQRHPASLLYDISAQAAGYYREHSTGVPVFPNVTSVQNFDLIPLPAGADEPLPDGDITFYNDMPQY